MLSEQRIGRYEVVRRLGKGGMGKVYLARDPDLDRLVALKLLHGDQASQPEARELFRREARSLAALNHPGIVTIYEINHDGPRVFIAMEYLPGRTLREALEIGEMGRGTLLRSLSRVALALSAAHGAGVLHRDVKPDNVMVGEQGAVNVVDFGVARRLEEAPAVRSGRSRSDRLQRLADVFTRTLPQDSAESRETVPMTAATDTIFGTPAYMAPEVLAGLGASPKSDVYSLGVVLFECLTGTLPYHGENLVKTLDQVIDVHSPAPRVESVAPDVPPALADLVAHALEKRPEERPRMAELADRLAELAALESGPDSPATGAAEPPSGTAEVAGASRPSPRSPWVAMIATAAAVATLSAIAVSVLIRGDAAPAETRPVAGEEAPTAAPASAPIAVAIEPFRSQIFSYANSQPSSIAISDLVGRLLSRVEGLRVVSAQQLRDQSGPLSYRDPASERAAIELESAFLVRGSLVEESGELTGEIELLDLTSKEVLRSHTATGTVEEMDELLAELAGAVAVELVPGATVEASGTRRSLGSLEHYERGTRALYRADWSNAAIHLERAVTEAPEFYDAWYYLALARGWAGTRRIHAIAAIERAVELARGEERRVAQGVARFLRYDNAGAREILEELHREMPHSRDVAYFLAEAEFHDGMYDVAMKHFRHTLEVAPRFQLAAVHPLQHALARRDEQAARFYLRVLEQENEDAIDFAMQRYERLLKAGEGKHALQAYVVLGRAEQIPEALLPPEGSFSGQLYRLATAAAAGREAEAQQWFDRVWEGVLARAGSPDLEFSLARLGEVVITAEMAEATRELLGYWEEHPPALPSQTHGELSIFAAPLLKEPSLAGRGQHGARARISAQAIRAEMRKEHGRAIELLQPLVAEPSPDYDYLARHALARNLRAAGREKELEELCSQSSRPAIFRWAYLPLRSACRRLGSD